MNIVSKKGFMSRLAPYNKPCINVFFGIIASCVQGCIFPTFGTFMAKMLFTYMGDRATLREDSNFWCLWMLIAAIIAFITGFTQKFGFGIVGENITMNVRHALYQAIVKKNIGWFDRRENAPGILTSTLASEAQALNGASTEGVAVILESTFATVCGIILGFIFTWRLALVALACVPFMMFGGMMNSKLHAGMSNFDDKAYKDANLLAGDAILNFRTVAGLAADKSIVKTYDNYIELPVRAAIKKAHCIGIWFGFSQFV